jgi:general secretion pathway protein B
MSYILEAIKKAESERGETRLYKNNHVDNSERADIKIPWVAIAIFVNAAILLVWIGIQLFSDSRNKNDHEERVVQSNVQQPMEKTQSLTPEKEKDERPQINVLDNNEVALKNNEFESNQTSKESNNDKPRFITKPVEAERITEKIISANKMSSVHKKIVPAKVESLPITESVLLDSEEGHRIIEDESNIELPIEVGFEQEIPIVENLNVPNFNELPYSMQQGIPEVVISVHIYNVVKDARKVRVNGKLLHQGDSVSDDLIIQEITTYGVIFNYSGELFKITLR